MIASVDIGTTTMKGALFALDGTCLAKAWVPITHAPCTHVSWHETDPNQWVSGLETICASLGSTASVTALVISANGPTLVPMRRKADGSIDAAYRALTWMDRRSTAEAQEVSEIMGTYVDPSFFLPKALHVARRMPEVYRETEAFFFVSEYMNCLLTGKSGTILPGSHFDVWYWNDSVLESLGLDHRKFPPFISPGDVVGQVLPEAADRFGFPKDMQVIAGGPDFLVSILGTGSVQPGRVCDRAGTSEGINLCTEKLVSDPRLMCYGHIAEPYVNLSGIITSTGSSISWIRNILGMKSGSYKDFYAVARTSPPGARGLVFLPYLAGERAPIWDPRAKGVFLGLTAGHEAADLVRSVTEGIALAIRDVIEVMEEIGCRVDELRVTGGPAESSFLNQLKADVTGKKVLVPDMIDSELLGDACLAAAGLGLYTSAADAAGEYVTFSQEYEPNSSLADLYNTMFSIYRETYTGTQHAMHTLADLTHQQQ